MSPTSPLLGDGAAAAGQSIEQRKQPTHAGWRSSVYIIGVEVAERFTYVGIAGNLVTYLTNNLHENTTTAVNNVNVWGGVSTMLPLFGAFVADSYLGRYHTILFSSLIYILGLSTLTLAVSMVNCRFQESLFFISLYLVAIGEAGHKPCMQAFGADQFDESSEEQRRAKNSFFNWWYLGQCSGITGAILLVYYLQDYMGWTIGYGILAIAMVFGLVLFLLGSRLYRRQGPSGSSLAPVAQVLVASARKLNLFSTIDSNDHKLEKGQFHEQRGPWSLTCTNQFRFFDKASIINEIEWRVCSSTQVEEVKPLLRLVPIWFSCFMYTAVIAQVTTFFTKQSSTVDRTIFSTFAVPSASFQVATSLTAIVTLPIYDRIIIPITRRITRTPSGLTMLQRIGFGLFLSIIAMVVAALVERRRLQIARELDLVHSSHVTIPLSVWWMLPQFVICGVSDVFAVVGMQEFFYDQMPDELRSIGGAAYLSIFGIGSFLSSGIISIVEGINSGWLVDNLNQAHLDYFYWLLAGLSTLWFCLFLWLSKRFVYKPINVTLS